MSNRTLERLGKALADAAPKTPEDVVRDLETFGMTALRGGDVTRARRVGPLAVLKRADRREVLMDRRAIELAAFCLGLKVTEPLGGAALRRVELGAHPVVRFDPSNRTDAHCRAYSLLVDGHDDAMGIYIALLHLADEDEDAGAKLARRVAAALNATRHLDVEDLEKLG